MDVEPVRLVDDRIRLVDEPIGWVDERIRLVDGPIGWVDERIRLVDEPIGWVDQPPGVDDEPVGLVDAWVGLVEERIGLVDESFCARRRRRRDTQAPRLGRLGRGSLGETGRVALQDLLRRRIRRTPPARVWERRRMLPREPRFFDVLELQADVLHEAALALVAVEEAGERARVVGRWYAIKHG